jgi:hypothetical protein
MPELDPGRHDGRILTRPLELEALTRAYWADEITLDDGVKVPPDGAVPN